ncbi:unnamed protein product, partial [Symbiodinium sp. CCMP2592]
MIIMTGEEVKTDGSPVPASTPPKTPAPVTRRTSDLSTDRSSATKQSLPGSLKAKAKALMKPRGKGKGKGSKDQASTRLRGKQPAPQNIGENGDAAAKVQEALQRASTADQMKTPELSGLPNKKKSKKQEMTDAEKAQLALLKVNPGLKAAAAVAATAQTSEEESEQKPEEACRKKKGQNRKEYARK